MTRESWRTRVGFIVAAVESVVGLGNIWRFPWMTAENGGSAFLVVSLAIILLVGVPGLLAEFVIGRRSQRNPAGALFVSLASVFAQLPFGRLLTVTFFGVVTLAALSSSISMLEIPVAYLVDEHDLDRRTATLALAGLVLFTGRASRLSARRGPGASGRYFRYSSSERSS
jgi:SNF family Na+-dependent transporter